MLNVVAMMGRLVADPVLRQTTTGKQVASFRLACDRGRKDANGRSTADFFDVVAWERLAEFACTWFTKGQLVAVTGRLQTRQYQNRTVAEIRAASLDFAEPKRSAQPGGPQEAGPELSDAAPAGQPAAKPYPAEDDFIVLDDEGDLPF